MQYVAPPQLGQCVGNTVLGLPVKRVSLLDMQEQNSEVQNVNSQQHYKGVVHLRL